MKAKCAILLVVLFVQLSACARKVNDPVDVQAIKDVNTIWDKAWNAGNADALASIYTADAVAMDPNQPASVGRDAIRASCQKYFEQFSDENRVFVEDVRVSGDLAVARGTQETRTSPKGSDHSVQDKTKWVTAFERQPDGSWKAFWDIWNSDLPVADGLPLGEEELTLLQIEREWCDAVVRKDLAWFETVLADDFAANWGGQVTQRRQLLADLKSGAYTVESMTPGEMKVLVFGQTAVVHGLGTEKSRTRGKDTSGQYRWTDIFEKRDGRWQCVGGYSSKVG